MARDGFFSSEQRVLAVSSSIGLCYQDINDYRLNVSWWGTLIALNLKRRPLAPERVAPTLPSPLLSVRSPLLIGVGTVLHLEREMRGQSLMAK